MKPDRLHSKNVIALLSAQFLSALADNALLFAAIARLQAQAAPVWQIPLLQATFILAFILLAPFAGSFADAWPKGRVMLAANSMKLAGAGLMLLGLNPLMAYNLVGVGAAVYSPAKYGILSELVRSDQLLKANALMEGSTIVAILLGAVLGGMLADASVPLSLIAVCVCYLLAAGANMLIPHLPVAHARTNYAPIGLIRDFGKAICILLGSRDARFSILGTSVFWGAGSTLRMLLVAWVPVALGIVDLSMPADLSGAVAIGIASGATAAALLITFSNINRVLPSGMAIGLVIIAFAHCTNLYLAIALLTLVGACGGFYIVPLNALLQKRGHETVGAGHAVAVQNFFENLSMLAWVCMYAAMQKNGLPVVQSATIFGSAVLLAITLIALFRMIDRSAPLKSVP